MHCHEMLYLYQQHAGSSFVLVHVYWISLGEYHISPVNILFVNLHLIGAGLDINLVFCYHISTHSFHMYIICFMTHGSCRSFRCQLKHDYYLTNLNEVE